MLVSIFDGDAVATGLGTARLGRLVVDGGVSEVVAVLVMQQPSRLARPRCKAVELLLALLVHVPR